MRVTNKMLTTSVIRNINASLVRMQKAQEQMNTSKQINRPSDDPVRIARLLSLKSALRSSDQYKNNMEDGKDWLDAMDNALGGVTEILHSLSDLAMSGANDTVTQTSRDAMAMQVEEMAGDLAQLANSQYAGRYIFAGTNNTQQPFTRPPLGDPNHDQLQYSGNSELMNWEVSPGVSVQVNQPGDQVFAVDNLDPNKPSGFFTILMDLRDALSSGDSAAISSDIIPRLSAQLDSILTSRAEIGARTKRLEMALDRSEVFAIGMQELLSKLQDIDLPEAVMNFKAEQNVYQAALATTAQMLPMSLVNFLR